MSVFDTYLRFVFVKDPSALSEVLHQADAFVAEVGGHAGTDAAGSGE